MSRCGRTIIYRMIDYSLSADEASDSRAAHRCTRDEREAERIKAAVLPASGHNSEDVADTRCSIPTWCATSLRGTDRTACRDWPKWRTAGVNPKGTGGSWLHWNCTCRHTASTERKGRGRLGGTAPFHLACTVSGMIALLHHLNGAVEDVS